MKSARQDVVSLPSHTSAAAEHSYPGIAGPGEALMSSARMVAQREAIDASFGAAAQPRPRQDGSRAASIADDSPRGRAVATLQRNADGSPQAARLAASAQVMAHGPRAVAQRQTVQRAFVHAPRGGSAQEAVEDAPVLEEAEQLAALRTRLAGPAYAYLRPFAEPLFAQIEQPAMPALERVSLLARGQALFSVSHVPDGGDEPGAKRASNAHHEGIGTYIEAQLAQVPRDGEGPEEALACIREAALSLQAQVGPMLEDGVAASVEPQLTANNEIELDVAIAPNDWRSHRGLGALALVVVAGSATAVWVWRRKTRAPVVPDAELQAPALPIRGGINQNNDCFMLAVLQMVASAYAGQIAADVDDDTRPYRGETLVDVQDDLVKRRALRAAVRNALPLLNSPGAALDADNVAELRALMQSNGVVDSPDGQEDAGETLRKLLDRLRPRVTAGTRTAAHVGRREERHITGSLSTEAVGAEPQDEPIDYGRGGRRERDSVEDAIYVPVTGGTGLIDYLTRTCGPGITDNFDPRRTGRYEWARVNGEDVSITAVRVTQHFTQLPPVLTVVVQRWREDMSRDGRAYAMPESLTIPVHDGGWPLIKTYRLQAVVYHRGASAQGGHYWAHRRSGDHWLRADDSRVTEDRQSARPQEPVEGELLHDVDHGYLYTYVLQGERRAWWGGLPAGTAMDAAALPPALDVHAEEPRAEAGPSATQTFDHGPRRSRGTRGGPARSAPAPDMDKAMALLPRADRFDFPEKLGELVDMALPSVLQAYTAEMVDPKTVASSKPTMRTVSLMHAGAATALIENLVVWWMVLHPSETRQGLERIEGYLWHHVRDTVAVLLKERGQRDIGELEEDEGGTEETGTAKPQAPKMSTVTAELAKNAGTTGITAPKTASPSAVDGDDPFANFGYGGYEEEDEKEKKVDEHGVPLWLIRKCKPMPKEAGQHVERLGGSAYPSLCGLLRSDPRAKHSSVVALLAGYLADETEANRPLVELMESSVSRQDVSKELGAAVAKVSAATIEKLRAAFHALGIAYDDAPLATHSTRDRSAKSPAEQALPMWLYVSDLAELAELRKRLIKDASDGDIAGLMSRVLNDASAKPLASALAQAMNGSKTGGELFNLLAPLMRKQNLGAMARKAFVDALLKLAGTVHGLDEEELTRLREVPTEEGLRVDAVLAQAQQTGWVTKAESERVGAMIGRRALAGILSRAMKGGAPGTKLSSKLSGTRAVIESIDGDGGKEDLGPPLSARSLIVDTNLVDVLLKDRKALDKDEAEFRGCIEAMMREHNITDLRLANINRGETFQHGSLIGTEFILEVDGEKRALKWYGVPLAPEVDHRGAYADVFDQLEQRAVGERKGHADRSMVADALCAETELRGLQGQAQQRVTPHFATADEGILKPLSSFAKGRDKKPLDYKRPPKDTADFFDFLKRTTGAHTFRAEVQGRALNVHAISKPKPETAKPPKAKPTGAPKDSASKEAPLAPARKPASDSPFDQFVIGDHTVADLIRLIRLEGYDAVISGGAVRDLVRGNAPNDVDLKANIPHALLALRLREAWKATAIAIVADKGLLQIGDIDVMCGEPGAKPGGIDRAEVAAKADFRMNALQIDLGDKVPSDPLSARGDGVDGIADAKRARLTFVADPGPGTGTRGSKALSVGERASAVIEYLKKEPWVLGRTLKFLARGYEIEPGIFDAIRAQAQDILVAMHLHKRALDEKSELLHKAGVSSPEELVLLMRRFHFTPEAVRMAMPDSIAGRHGDGGTSFERSVMPRNRGIEGTEGAWNPHRPPQLKVDVETGRIYQYRIDALLPTKEVKPRGNAQVQTHDKVIIDVDCSNHDISGHPSPHYHVYRWIGGKWDKKQSGLSSTGQPGAPPMDNNVYLGPMPWRWTDDLPASDVARRLAAQPGGQVKVAVDSDLVTLGTQIRIHRQRLDELHAAGQMAKLLLLVHNLDAGLPWDPEEQIAKDLAGSRKGQQRLRFGAQVDAVVTPFLANCGVAMHELFGKLDDATRHRLHDLAAANPREALRKPAAAWALEKATTVVQFVQRFEFFLAVAGEDRVPEGSAVDAALTQSLEAVGAEGLVAAVKIEPLDDLPKRVRDAAKGLGFANADSAAYHARKHSRGGATAEKSAAAYLNAARETVITADSVDSTTEADGASSLVFWRGNDKAVVRVERDGTAHLLTFFTKGE